MIHMKPVKSKGTLRNFFHFQENQGFVKYCTVLFYCVCKNASYTLSTTIYGSNKEIVSTSTMEQQESWCNL